jgi:hypothetical protein
VKVVGTMLMHSLMCGHDEMNPYYSKAMTVLFYIFEEQGTVCEHNSNVTHPSASCMVAYTLGRLICEHDIR